MEGRGGRVGGAFGGQLGGPFASAAGEGLVTVVCYFFFSLACRGALLTAVVWVCLAGGVAGGGDGGAAPAAATMPVQLPPQSIFPSMTCLPPPPALGPHPGAVALRMGSARGGAGHTTGVHSPERPPSQVANPPAILCLFVWPC